MHLGILLVKMVLLTCTVGSLFPEDPERFERSPGRLSSSVLYQRRVTQPRESKREDYGDFETLPEYTEGVSDIYTRGLDQLSSQRHYPICRIKRRVRRLNTMEYEYRPAYYEEIECVPEIESYEPANEICSSLGFSCVQWNKTIHLTRRRYSSECWETRTLVIPAGCECMWPAHRLGDIPPHSRQGA